MKKYIVTEEFLEKALTGGLEKFSKVTAKNIIESKQPVEVVIKGIYHVGDDDSIHVIKSGINNIDEFRNKDGREGTLIWVPDKEE